MFCPLYMLGSVNPPKSLNDQEIVCFYSINHEVSMLAPGTANPRGTTGPKMGLWWEKTTT